MNNYYGMAYRGYHFNSEWETEADGNNKKLWHTITDPAGNVSSASIGGSYTFPNTKEVHDYIDLIVICNKSVG